jgi:hypothetical protein
MTQPFSTEGNALATSLICAALLEKLVSTGALNNGNVEALLRTARQALGNGPVRASGETDAAKLIDGLIARYAAKQV